MDKTFPNRWIGRNGSYSTLLYSLVKFVPVFLKHPQYIFIYKEIKKYIYIYICVCVYILHIVE